MNNPINNLTNNPTNNPKNTLNSGLSHTPTSQSLNHQWPAGHQHQVSNYGKILTAQHNQECTTNTGGKKYNSK